MQKKPIAQQSSEWKKDRSKKNSKKLYWKKTPEKITWQKWKNYSYKNFIFVSDEVRKQPLKYGNHLPRGNKGDNFESKPVEPKLNCHK